MDTMKDTTMQPAKSAVIEELRKVIADCYWPTSPVTINEILDRLEAAEKERDKLKELNSALCTKSNSQVIHNARLAEENDALRAKVEAMEQQAPARLVTAVAYRWRYRGAVMWQYGELKEETVQVAKEHNHEVQSLGVLPGAHPAPSVPDGWLRAIDEALVTAHIGVANAHDTYEQAKAKLDNLIGFHVDVATDPAVNGGWKLMPIEPTKEIYECFSAYDGTSYSNPFDFDDFSVDYAFALEAAPEAKS